MYKHSNHKFGHQSPNLRFEWDAPTSRLAGRMKLARPIATLTVLWLFAADATGQTASRTARLPSEFVPSGFVVSEEVRGDLNKDGLEDRVLVIKATDKSEIVMHESRGRLDRNRRGIIVAIQTESGYRLLASNPTCFSSENEDGGVYFAPELSVTIASGTLNIHYAHGRYGYWEYKFRVQNGDVELIGYEGSENHGPIVLRETSINMSTKRMRVRENTDATSEQSGAEKFSETWQSFALNRPIALRTILDFDGFDLKGKLTWAK